MKFESDYLFDETQIHRITCSKCGETITWIDSDYVNGSIEDDKFFNVIDKLRHHQHDKICIREQKLKELLNKSTDV